MKHDKYRAVRAHTFAKPGRNSLHPKKITNVLIYDVTFVRKFDRGLTRFLYHDLHWLDVPQRITFKLCLLVFKCLHDLAPRYLAELCVPVADVMGRRNLRSATRGLQNFTRFNMKNYGRRAFSYAGPHAWSSLPEHLRHTTSIDYFKRSLKTFIFGQISRLAH